ncbi:MAG: DinB family protein [Nocardiopsaceae bacterium]|nr:DinB family protein [Nocardiopsaceae bacterium]
MDEQGFKADLHRYLRTAREAVLWKLEGLSEYDVRRPLVPTGNNLLGMVKHLAGVEFGYFGATFGRPSPDEPSYDFDADPNAEWVAGPDQSRDFIIGLYRKAWVHSDATIEALPLDATGQVPWWLRERNPVTLHRILIHVIAETDQHRGHADVIRELIDGAAGLRSGVPNLGAETEEGRRAFYNRVERAAREASRLSG